MKKTLTTSEIVDRLYQDNNAAWTVEGAQALADYLEEYEAETGEELELDIVAIRCEFSEYETAREACEEYDLAEDIIELIEEEELDADETEQAAVELLEDQTLVLEHENGVIIQDY